MNALMSGESSHVIRGTVSGEKQKALLSKDAFDFICLLHSKFESRRQEILSARHYRQQSMSKSIMPDFLPQTAHIREDNIWRGPSLGPGLVDRRVELTGPVDRKMLINGLNSDATQYMADFEDSTSPTWNNIINGQVNLLDANKRNLEFIDPNGKAYQLNKKDQYPTLIVRPRGWHMIESHFMIEGVPISASLFDFGLYFYHNAHLCIRNGHGPYFYLPKMEGHLEARLWNEIFEFSEVYLGISHGTIRATVLIETIMAAFEMEEIIYELRSYSSGLNCGRWDYIFSYIKKLSNDPKHVLPDRSRVTMKTPFMASYVKLLIHTCHKRGVHAMGGMAAQIPIKSDAVGNNNAMDKVREDKLNEVLLGHDGTWVAHPALIPIAKSVFDEHMPQSNQINRSITLSHQYSISAKDLLEPPSNPIITLEGIKMNVKIALIYIDNWMKGVGCVPINNLMEDAATAEICRSQIWQYLKHKAIIQGLDRAIRREEVEGLIDQTCSDLHYSSKIATILKKLCFSDQFVDFFVEICYPILISNVQSKI